jgi:hypothetical protein
VLPLVLAGQQNVSVLALVDSGATVNVLPYSIGEQLGFVWDIQTVRFALGGNLASVEARAVGVSAVVGGFSPVRLAFAWAKTDAAPVLLGQMNFFLEFDICFYRDRALFEVRPK